MSHKSQSKNKVGPGPSEKNMFNVNERTLQIEWVATWSPIEKQYNVHVVAAVAIVREL